MLKIGFKLFQIVGKEWLTFSLQDMMNIVQELRYLQDNQGKKLLSVEKYFLMSLCCPTLGIATSLKVLGQLHICFMKNISHEKFRVVD